MVRKASDWTVGPASGWGAAGLASTVPGQQLFSTADGLYQDGVWWFLHKSPPHSCGQLWGGWYLQRNEFGREKDAIAEAVLVTRAEAPAMISWYNHFIAPCQGDAGPPKFLNYHGFRHVMTPGVKVVYSIGSGRNKTGCNTRLLEELYGDTEWTPEHALLTDLSGKVNHFNCELEGKCKTAADRML